MRVSAGANRWVVWLGLVVIVSGCPGGSVFDSHLEAGDQLLREGRVDEAIAAYQRALDSDPERPEAWRRKAIALVLAQQVPDALDHFERAAALDPQASAEELVFWATALQRSGRTAEAASKYEQALAVNPNHVPAMNNLASLLHASDPERATRLLESAVRLEPGDTQLVYNLGRLYERTGRPEEAFNLIRRATAAMKTDDPAYAKRIEHLEALRARLPREPAPAQAPNFLIVVIDTLRADHMGLYGYERATTPNMDRLAKEAVVFENAISQAPWTAPSLASLFTGLYPSVHGLDTGIVVDETYDPLRKDRPFALQKALRSSQITLAEVLRRNGFETAGFVSQVYVASIFGFSQGFDTYHDPDYTTGAKIRGSETNRKVFEWLEEGPSEPFLLFVHYNDPHFAYDPPSPFGEKFISDYGGQLRPEDTKRIEKLVRERELGAEDIRYVMGLYDGEIAYVDSVVGSLMERISAADLERPLVTVITSDHGEEFLEHGNTSHGFTLFDEQLHVPLLVHAPGLLSPRRVVGQVRLIDVAPTLLELAGIEADGEAFQGESFASALRGRPIGAPRAAFSEATWKADQQSIRTEQGLKLIQRTEDGSVQLYDLGDDPEETRDLAAERPELTEALREELRLWNEASRERRAAEGDVAQGVGEVVLGEATQEQLKALGYLE